MTKYRTIVADPPWPISWHGGGTPRHGIVGGTSKRSLGYDTMSVEDICALPVTGIAEAAAGLFLWVTAPLNREGVGVRVARAWGFEPVGEFVWDKGMRIAGAFPRSCHEIVLVCKRGAHQFTPESWVASVQRWPRPGSNRHSQKPEHLQDLVEQVSDGPYVELFSRRQRMGWDSWGNESANTATLEVPA